MRTLIVHLSAAFTINTVERWCGIVTQEWRVRVQQSPSDWRSNSTKVKNYQSEEKSETPAQALDRFNTWRLSCNANQFVLDGLGRLLSYVSLLVID